MNANDASCIGFAMLNACVTPGCYNTGAKHHIIDINFARLISLLKQHINTTILIDAFLLDTGDGIDIFLGTPWLADLGGLTWDFSTMELQNYRNRRPISFTIILPRRSPWTVLTLPARVQPAPPPAQQSTAPPPTISAG
jgi:hypothetical protein